jgi:hypothetical protein
VLNVIEQSPPYHKTPPGEDPLAALNSLVSQDKHRAVPVVGFVRTKFDVDHPDFEVVTMTRHRPLRRREQNKAPLVCASFSFYANTTSASTWPVPDSMARYASTKNILIDALPVGREPTPTAQRAGAEFVAPRSYLACHVR